MQIAWLHYQKNAGSTYYMVLIAHELEDRYIGLLSSKITDEEIKRIRKNTENMSKYDTHELMDWLKKNISEYNQAYREFKKDKTRIDRLLEIKPIGD